MTYLMWLIEQADSAGTMSTRYNGGVCNYTEFGAFLDDVMEYVTTQEKLHILRQTYEAGDYYCR